MTDDRWEVFRRPGPGKASRGDTMSPDPRARLAPRFATLNPAAFALLGTPSAMILGVDRAAGVIGLRPAERDDPDAYVVLSVGNVARVNLHALWSTIRADGTTIEHGWRDVELDGEWLAIPVRR